MMLPKNTIGGLNFWIVPSLVEDFRLPDDVHSGHPNTITYETSFIC